MTDTTTVMPDTTVIPGLTRNLDTTVVEVSKPIVENNQQPVIDREKPAETVDIASPETVVRSEKLTRAEKRALRKAERKARRELRRAARLARRQARQARRNKTSQSL